MSLFIVGTGMAMDDDIQKKITNSVRILGPDFWLVVKYHAIQNEVQELKNAGTLTPENLLSKMHKHLDIVNRDSIKGFQWLFTSITKTTLPAKHVETIAFNDDATHIIMQKDISGSTSFSTYQQIPAESDKDKHQDFVNAFAKYKTLIITGAFIQREATENEIEIITGYRIAEHWHRISLDSLRFRFHPCCEITNTAITFDYNPQTPPERITKDDVIIAIEERFPSLEKIAHYLCKNHSEPINRNNLKFPNIF